MLSLPIRRFLRPPLESTWLSCSSSFRSHRSATRDSIIEIPVEAQLPPRGQVVIAGSGLIGNSVAYHLVENGWQDVVIIDRGNIADGTSKSGSGMLGLFRPAHERKIVQYCIELYRKLQQKVNKIHVLYE